MYKKSEKPSDKMKESMSKKPMVTPPAIGKKTKKTATKSTKMKQLKTSPDMGR